MKCRQTHFSLIDRRCHGNKIRDKNGYNLPCVKDICKIFAFVVKFSEMGHQMLLTVFYPDRPLLPRQQNLRQNGLYQKCSHLKMLPVIYLTDITNADLKKNKHMKINTVMKTHITISLGSHAFPSDLLPKIFSHIKYDMVTLF